MIASDITHGHLLLADWLFLIAALLAFLAAVAHAPMANTPKLSVWAGTLLALAIVLIAVAWLVL